MADDISDLGTDINHGHDWRKRRARWRQKDIARYVLEVQIAGWRTMAAVRAAMTVFNVSRASVFAALSKHRANLEREPGYQRWLKRGIRRVLR